MTRLRTRQQEARHRRAPSRSATAAILAALLLAIAASPLLLVAFGSATRRQAAIDVGGFLLVAVGAYLSVRRDGRSHRY